MVEGDKVAFFSPSLSTFMPSTQGCLNKRKKNIFSTGLLKNKTQMFYRGVASYLAYLYFPEKWITRKLSY